MYIGCSHKHTDTHRHTHTGMHARARTGRSGQADSSTTKRPCDQQGKQSAARGRRRLVRHEHGVRWGGRPSGRR